jgi:hypothetical protein
MMHDLRVYKHVRGAVVRVHVPVREIVELTVLLRGRGTPEPCVAHLVRAC